MADAADLKSSLRLLTYCYQVILSSIYRRFSRQRKLTSCLVSLGNWLIFGSSSIKDEEELLCLSVCIHNSRQTRQSCLYLEIVAVGAAGS